MSLLQFATDVREIVPFTNKLSQIDRGLGQLRGDWATALYDAICLGSERLGGKQGAKCWCGFRRRRYRQQRADSPVKKQMISENSGCHLAGRGSFPRGSI
jgi:hypothetical protein